MRKKDQSIFKKSDGVVQQTEGKGLISKHKIRSFYLWRMHQFAEIQWLVTEMYTFGSSLIFHGLQ